MVIHPYFEILDPLPLLIEGKDPLNTYFSHNSASKPDCVLSNNKFYYNYHITSGGLGPTDHLSIDI